MKKHVRILCLVMLPLMWGCSSDIAKRTAYESLQNKAQMDCQQNPGSACPEKKSYDDYQRELKERKEPVK